VETPAPRSAVAPIQQLLNLSPESAVPIYVEAVLETLAGKRNVAIVIDRGQSGKSEVVAQPVRLHISLQTDNLGPMTADLAYGQGLSCTVAVCEDAADLVRAGLPLLRQRLVDAGLRVLSVACKSAVAANPPVNGAVAEEGTSPQRAAGERPQTGLQRQIDIRA
jgi:hypothetical protein